MARFAWIWAAGSVAWTIDGVISLRLNNRLHAELAFMVAAMFLVAWIFYRGQKT